MVFARPFFDAVATEPLPQEPVLAAQVPEDPIDILWHKAFGTPDNNEMSHDIIALPDGGAVIAYFQNGTGQKIRRVDEDGEMVWDKAYNYESYYPRIGQLARLDDGSIVGVGQVMLPSKPGSDKKKFQPFAMKVTEDGDVVWQKHYLSWMASALSDIDVCKDGDLIVAGTMGMPFIAFGGAIHVMKIDPDGTRIWDQTLGPKQDETGSGRPFQPYFFGSMTIDGNDEILVNGRYGGSPRKISSHNDMIQIVARLSQKGEILSEHEYGDERWEMSNDALVDGDGNMVIAGSKSFEDESKNGIYVSTFTPKNKVKWETIINEPFTGALGGLIQRQDGTFIGAGGAMVPSEERIGNARWQDMIIICISKDGELLWSKKYENLGKMGIKAMDLSDDGHLWVLSDIGYSGPGPEDVYLAKLILK